MSEPERPASTPASEHCPKCGHHLVQTGHGPYCPESHCKWGWEIELDGSPLKPPVENPAPPRPEVDLGTPEEVIAGIDWINKHNAEVRAAAPPTPPPSALPVTVELLMSVFEGRMWNDTWPKSWPREYWQGIAENLNLALKSALAAPRIAAPKLRDEIRRAVNQAILSNELHPSKTWGEKVADLVIPLLAAP